MLASGDAAFFTTAHYDGHGSILVDLDRIAPDQLAELIEEAWRQRGRYGPRTRAARRRPVDLDVAFVDRT